ncbi:MAG: hypothetical protein KatS3mg082_0252 [Nitrospiraceae bacterium]|nr:MAG: hypothetical protein KatS3mg082_0252 [Nitrospiraceae bacterium]
MNDKKPYSPPEVYRVELNQEQAILSACSIMTSAAFNGGTTRCNVRFIPCKRMSFPIGDMGPRPS